MQDAEIINVRIPDELTKKIDELLEKNLFKSRSELIRVLLREYVQENKKRKTNEHSS